MQREFLQEKSLNSSQDNAEKSLNVDLSAKSRLIPFSTTQGMLGLYDLYVEERNACENYRMIFTVNPVCSNVLYNAVTEPVYKEGSFSAISLVQSAISRNLEQFNDIFECGPINQSGKSIDQIFAIRDTELSHEKIGNFKYHCGYDIFNNHLLRTNDFNHVRLAEDKPVTNKETFNTIFDFAIDYSGNPVVRIIDEDSGSINPSDAGTSADNILNDHKQKMRMYQLDTIKTFNTAFYDGLREVDGWYGFYNTGYINIPNATVSSNTDTAKTEEISVNRILNNETSCGFVELYPDRSLYSFIPKVNRYRKRIERNWDCTIVYPYESDYDMFNRVVMNFSGTPEEWEAFKKVEKNKSRIPNAVRIMRARVTYNNVGDEVLEMTSLLRHTLKPGDEIRLFYTTSDYIDGKYEEIKRFSVPVRVINVGDTKGNNADRCFFIKLSDITTFCGVNDKKEIRELDDKGEPKGAILSFFYRKIEDGYDDNYYFRKFKQLKNYEYYSCDKDKEGIGDDEVVVLKKEPINVDENSPEYIKVGDEYFKRNDRPLTYTQNKISFAENIYGDRVAQVIFNDDICITGLKDNIGRPLSTVYFAAIKTNQGYKEWYEEGNISAETVEYSHCFGDLSSGLDLPEYTIDENKKDAIDFNVRRLHNVFSDDCTSEGTYREGLKIIMADAPVGHGKDNTPLPIESGITSDFNEFYGDIVEFNRASFKETTIDKVYYRFNTAQRECLKNKKYFDIHYDNLYGDTYDVKTTGTSTTDTTTPASNSGFSVSSYTLNEIQSGNTILKFPGNIAPEGYFYSPFYEVTLKELDDELQFVTTKRINFVPSAATAETVPFTFYNPDMGSNEVKDICVVEIISPTNYDFISGRPFSIYDIDKNLTYRGHLSAVTTQSDGSYLLGIATEVDIDASGLKGEKSNPTGKSQYIIAMLNDNAPTYAEYIPASGKLVWRAPKKMSDLSNDSPLYNMPFTNGRHYIHRNLNVYVRRQDSHGEFNLFKPSIYNPLRRFQVEGDARLDFGLIKYIIDTLVDAC